MKYFELVSELKRNKRAFPLKIESDSFHVWGTPLANFVSPRFKNIFDDDIADAEIVLVSAIGATGKTALAREVSRSLSLPILDLSKHKAVGSDSLTGVITNSYELTDVSVVLTSISNGQYSIIVDGVDEGRSKTNQFAFEAFLEDVARLCGGRGAKFILLGRTQVIEDCWMFFSEKGIKTALLSILPFSIEDANTYIDLSTKGSRPLNRESEYQEAKSLIIGKLKSIFAGSESNDFLAFLGYAPVLDAIATVLNDSRNYHKLILEFKSGGRNDIEILIEVIERLVDREREEKVLPNILGGQFQDVPEKYLAVLKENAFSREEQCRRLLSKVLGEECYVGVTRDDSIDDRYNEAVSEWTEEHPFLKDREMRNSVFEAYAVAVTLPSQEESAVRLLQKYFHYRKANHYVLYLLDYLLGGNGLPPGSVGIVIDSAHALMARGTDVSVEVDGSSVDDITGESIMGENAIVEISIDTGGDNQVLKAFDCTVERSDVIELKDRAVNTRVTVPCTVRCFSDNDFTFIAPIEIYCNELVLGAKDVILRDSSAGREGGIFVDANSIKSQCERITNSAKEVEIVVKSGERYTYPLIDFVSFRADHELDLEIREKYLRLRRILQEFRSHSKGSLAKLRHKIEHKRVLQNEIGETLLSKLVRDGALVLIGKFYHLVPDVADEKLGMNWIDLRKYKCSPKLRSYLKEV